MICTSSHIVTVNLVSMGPGRCQIIGYSLFADSTYTELLYKYNELSS